MANTSPEQNTGGVQEKYEVAQRLLESGRHAEALKTYLEIVDAGVRDPELFLQLGMMYHRGQGAARDYDEAERWFTRAAESGSTRGQYNLAVAAANRGDYDRARALLELAANQGFTPALYHLGRMYELGRWGPLDKARALGYFEEAATRGHIWAERQLAVMLIRGEAGLARVPEGARRLLTLLPKAWRLRKADPASENRWA